MPRCRKPLTSATFTTFTVAALALGGAAAPAAQAATLTYTCDVVTQVAMTTAVNGLLNCAPGYGQPVSPLLRAPYRIIRRSDGLSYTCLQDGTANPPLLVTGRGCG